MLALRNSYGILRFQNIPKGIAWALQLSPLQHTKMMTTYSLDRQLPEGYYQPREQLWFTYSKKLGRWVPPAKKKQQAPTAGNGEAAASSSRGICYTHGDGNDMPGKPRQGSPQTPPKFLLITWNIDAMMPHEDMRMATALRYLRTLVESPPKPFQKGTPLVIMLQEMLSSDLMLLRAEPWVMERFAITDLTKSAWDSTYGTVTLIDQGVKGVRDDDKATRVARLEIYKAFRVRWPSKFGRDGLFVDLVFPFPSMKRREDSSRVDKAEGTAVVRLCNTHLESLLCNPPVRPRQVARAATHLHEEGIHGAIMAGDMNAIQSSDRSIAEENNMIDAYLALGGQEDHDNGYTWGYQSRKGQRERFGCRRMDKVFYSGGLVVEGLQRIGVDVCVEDEMTRKRMKESGTGPWVTDHYGLMVEVEVRMP